MKKTLTLIAFSFTGLVTFAQQDAQFSMNMFNRLAVNPGYAGTNKALCATILYRDQWDKFPGAPKTGLLSVDFGTVAHGGVGLTIDQDQLGFDKTLKAKLAYSFHLPLGPTGTLGIGLDAGMISKSMSGNFIAPDGTSRDGGGGIDNAIPWSGTSATTYDVGFGLYYTNSNLYVGLSSLHLAGPAQKLSKKSGAAPATLVNNTSYDFTYEMARHYYVMAGYKFNLGTEFDLTPSILTKSDASSTQLDINLLARWHRMVFVGVSYRLTDAIPVMVGMEWNGFKLGYAYDVTLSAIKSHSSGTHELMLGYCHKFIPVVHKTGHMNVRFL
ncbi:MAG: type IX secretion system membrane protein PorP/SprF [Bacteroidetes bacterium]|nr:type IX secretion system membrane protein PorP/SprF [Bacteroidota bacterium]